MSEILGLCGETTVLDTGVVFLLFDKRGSRSGLMSALRRLISASTLCSSVLCSRCEYKLCLTLLIEDRISILAFFRDGLSVDTNFRFPPSANHCPGLSGLLPHVTRGEGGSATERPWDTPGESRRRFWTSFALNGDVMVLLHFFLELKGAFPWLKFSSLTFLAA